MNCSECNIKLIKKVQYIKSGYRFIDISLPYEILSCPNCNSYEFKTDEQKNNIDIFFNEVRDIIDKHVDIIYNLKK